MEARSMKKLKIMPKLAREITITVISLVVLCVLWYFFIGEYIVISDQGLSTIGIALSTSLGVLTAIVVSFVLIVWQTSRRDRGESFLRWRNTLHQLFELYDANLERIMEIREEVMVLTTEASAAASIAPMDINRFRELTNKILDKIIPFSEQVQDIKNPTQEQVIKAKLYKLIMDLLVMLTHANFDHNVAHYSYKLLLSLRGLLYRILAVFIVCVGVVVMSATITSAGISDMLNAPLAFVLVVWVIYVLVHLGIEIKRFTRLEDEFRRQEDIQFPRAV